MRSTLSALCAALVLGLAACGGDDGGGTTTQPNAGTERKPSDELQIAVITKVWASRVAQADARACSLMIGAAATACERGLTPPPSSLQKSFDGVEVDQVAVKGSTADVRLSNGEEVVFSQEGGKWRVAKVAGKLFEP